MAAKQALGRRADPFDDAARSFQAFTAHVAEPFGDVGDADAELSGHRRGDARGQTLLEREVGVLCVAGKRKVDVDGVVVIFEKIDHGVARACP